VRAYVDGVSELGGETEEDEGLSDTRLDGRGGGGRVGWRGSHSMLIWEEGACRWLC
jgi:hypothetical protein